MSPTTPPTDRTATLWGRFAAPLRSFVAKRAPREAEADDLLQDVFLRIQEQLPGLREADRIDAWIFQIARNVIADAFRARGRREALAGRAAAEEAAGGPDDDERAAEASLAGCLASMIEQLPPPYREAIELTELRGIKQVDAARLVGISISGMKSRVQRGREQLKAIIHDVCRVETDVRGAVIECDPVRGGCGERLRPSPGASDSTGMMTTIEARPTETTTNDTTSGTESSGCCGGPAPPQTSGCCALDAQVKATGGAGCGCGPKQEDRAPATPAVGKQGCC